MYYIQTSIQDLQFTFQCVNRQSIEKKKKMAPLMIIFKLCQTALQIRLKTLHAT